MPIKSRTIYLVMAEAGYHYAGLGRPLVAFDSKQDAAAYIRGQRDIYHLYVQEVNFLPRNQVEITDE